MGSILPTYGISTYLGSILPSPGASWFVFESPGKLQSYPLSLYSALRMVHQNSGELPRAYWGIPTLILASFGETLSNVIVISRLDN